MDGKKNPITPPPEEIIAYCPSCGTRVRMVWVGEHRYYWVYECTVCGRRVLILKGEIDRFPRPSPAS